MDILQMFSYPFMQRALIAGVLVSLCAALLGVSLVLKRYSMIGDGLSHVSFGSLAIAVALGITPLYFSIPVVILAAFLLLRVADNPRWNSDAAIAAMSASALAIGILVISRTTGMTTDVDNYMFGSVLAMSRTDVALSVVLSIAVLVLFVVFYHKLFAITFDESFSRATGLKVDRYNTLLAILTALTIVVGMRMMGAMLISSLIIFPALTAMRLFRSFRAVVTCAAVTSVVCFCAGLTGFIVCAQSGTGTMNAGMSYETFAVAASVIGGISTMGGTGILSGVLAGASVWAVMDNGLQMVGTSVGLKNVVVGLIVIGSVLIDVIRRTGKLSFKKK